MCTGFTLQLMWPELRDTMNLLDDEAPEGFDAPRCAIVSGQRAVVIRADRDTHDRRADMMRWGLALRSSRDPSKGPIHAPIEAGAEKPMFRDAMAKRRCIVPATGYFAWQAGEGSRAPKVLWCIEPEGAAGRVLAFAGLWESHPEVGQTFCIMTTVPNALTAPIDDRMPVVLTPAQWDEWLADGPVRFDAAAPFPAACLRARRVVKAMEHNDAAVVGGPESGV
jgi:putative SOS response-associated peptidase YedK